MTRAPVPVVLAAILIGLVHSPRPAAAKREVSAYIGPSIHPDPFYRRAASFSARLGVVAKTNRVYRPGLEVGYMGLGTMGVAYVDDPMSSGDGLIHYDVFHAGPIVRVQTTRRQRGQAYGLLGVSPYALKFEDSKDGVFPLRKTRVGGSIGAGIYGMGPALFGVEVRWHMIPEGRRYPVRPLHLGTVMAGLNF